MIIKNTSKISSYANYNTIFFGYIQLQSISSDIVHIMFTICFIKN